MSLALEVSQDGAQVRVLADGGALVATLSRPGGAVGEWWHRVLSGMAFDAGDGFKWQWNGEEFAEWPPPPEEGE